MTPGYVNGVKVRWPEPVQTNPQPKKTKVRKGDCINGHTTPDRDKNGVCIACRREVQAEYRARVRAAKP